MLHASNANKIPIKNFWFFCFIVVILMKHCFHHLRKVRLKKYYIAVVYEHSYPLKGVKLKSSPYSLCIAVHCVQLYCCTGQNLILSRTCLTMIMRSSFLPRDSRYISLRVSDVPGGLWICRQHHRCSWSYLSAYKALALPFAAPYGFFVQECFLYLPTTAFCISLVSSVCASWLCQIAMSRKLKARYGVWVDTGCCLKHSKLLPGNVGK